MITRLLVANRGEIARRILWTCRDIGISGVAVYSDADADARHVAEANLAVRLPGNSPEETYLRVEAVVAAALASGADAVHPGYGFLSESAEFARQVIGAGLTWVGPPPAAIEVMGSKVRAKNVVASAGVPVLHQLNPSTVDDSVLPVLVKASAGGGGRGMRVVEELADLPAQIEAASAEAASAFGDGTVFCEPYLRGGRHIEVQVLADEHGVVWTLGERECSIQRRHQKVVEETPSPFVGSDLRARLCAAAVSAVKAIRYVGAATVEFLVAEDGRYFFLETNTRLQVEHPVTECVFGEDLVRRQIEIAEGARLPEHPPTSSGYAVEARLYAEDPAADWQPQSGVLHRLRVPGVDAEFSVPAGTGGTSPVPAGTGGTSPVPAGTGGTAGTGQGMARYGLRLDAGYVDGDVISTHYDPMLAKVIAWGPTRTAAIRRLAAALVGTQVHGVTTNRDLLVKVLRHRAFLVGDTDTSFLERYDLTAPLVGMSGTAMSALAAALADAADSRADARVLGGLPSGWRNVASQPQRRSYRVDGDVLAVGYRITRAGLLVTEPAVLADAGLVLRQATRAEVVLEVAGVRQRFTVSRYGDQRCVDSPLGSVTFEVVSRFPVVSPVARAGSLLAPMPGVVTAVRVTEGEVVRANQPLLVLEAMKMQHVVRAPEAGVVRSLRVTVGSQVQARGVLAVVVTAESAEENS